MLARYLLNKSVLNKIKPWHLFLCATISQVVIVSGTIIGHAATQVRYTKNHSKNLRSANLFLALTGIKLVQIFTYCECPSTVALTTKKPTSIILRNLSCSHLFLTTCFIRNYDFSQFASIFRVKSGKSGVFAANSIGGCIQSL